MQFKIDIAMFSGNNGIPPRAQFDAIIEAIRLFFPDFAVGLECME